MQVDLNIPLPPPRKQEAWPFKWMKVGESFAVPRALHRKARNAACAYQRSNPGVKFTIRKEGHDSWRMWRQS